MESRYIRHILLDKIGEEGQKKLAQQTIAIVGCGGLGNIAAAYLAGAGIAHLILIDGDRPDITNVHRQILYTGDENTTKSKALEQKLKQLNPTIKYTTHEERLSKSNCERILINADLVLECTDDIICKYLVNDFCVLYNIPLVYGAIHKYEGYVSLFRNSKDEDIHLRDIFPQPDLNIPNCSEVGVLSTIAGIIGLMQANEALKFVLNMGEILEGKLLTFNVLTYDQMNLSIKKSWKEDLDDIWESTDYTPLDCLVIPELTWSKVQKSKDEYNWVSIMSKEEHADIHADVQNLSIGEEEEIIKIAQEKTTIIYCRSGSKSKAFISQLLNKHPYLKLYNLAGGFMQFQKESSRS